MGVRRNAGWQERLDERILEILDDEPWSAPPIMVFELPISATESQIRDRCMVLADAELVHIKPADHWKCELTTRGKLYLKGELDVELYPDPRPPSMLEELKQSKSPAYWAATYHDW